MVARRGGERGRELGVGERVVGRCEEVAEELARAERAGPDLDDAQPRDVRQAAHAPEAHDLAALGPARARQAAGAEDDVRGEAVDRGEPDEPAADRALADERDPRGGGRGELGEGRGRLLVERRPPLVGPGRHAEPRRPHGAGVGGHPLDVLRHAPVLRDGPADEDAREDGGRGGDPERGGERARAAAPQPGERQADDVPRAAQDGRSWRRRYARAFSRPPQTCIEHQLDERLREPS